MIQRASAAAPTHLLIFHTGYCPLKQIGGRMACIVDGGPIANCPIMVGINELSKRA